MTLPSGLPEEVQDEEPISRFLTSHGHYNSKAIRPAAFMPNPKNGRLSVARHDAEPLSESERIARHDFNLPRAVGVAILEAREFRRLALDFEADDTPPRHADVIGWPWRESDPDFDKAERKAKAAALAQKARRIIYP